MNRYTIEGITSDARSGKAVLVSCRCPDQYLGTFEAMPGVERVHRGPHLRRIDFAGGGSIRLVSTARGALQRGIVVDVVVLLDGPSQTRLEEAVPLIVTSPCGEVIC